MAIQIINGSGLQYPMVVNPDGSIDVVCGNPINGANPADKIIYDSSNNIGSIYRTIDGRVYLKVLGYTAGNLTTVGAWRVSGT